MLKLSQILVFIKPVIIVIQHCVLYLFLVKFWLHFTIAVFFQKVFSSTVVLVDTAVLWNIAKLIHSISFVVSAAQLKYMCLPLVFYLNKLVDGVIQLSNLVLGQRTILDVRHFFDYLTDHACSPYVSFT